MSESYTAETIPISPVARNLVRAVLDAHPLPKHPIFDGEPLTLERLQEPKAWANGGRQRKAQAVFDRFLAEANEAQREQNDALYRLLMVRGVGLEPPPIGEWAGDLEELGVSADSVGPAAVKLLWIDHLLPEAMDRLELLVRIMEVSGLEAGGVDAVRGLFREALAAAKAAMETAGLSQRSTGE